MGEIVGAGLLSHVPTIMLPKKTRYELNNGREISLVPGLKTLKDDVLAPLGADTIIVFDTHWFSTVEFIVTGHERRAGLFTSDELPRGISQVPYDLPGHPQLAASIAQHVTHAGLRCISNDDPYLPIHYPTVNLAHYLASGERWLSVGMCQTAKVDDYLCVGRALAQAISATDTRVVLIASGGMSHRFWPLDELEDHEASDPIHVRTPEARAADLERLAWWADGDHRKVLDTMSDYLPHKPEGMFGHYLMMVAALGAHDCQAPGRQFSDYENAIGTGQVHVWFDRPLQGWTGRASGVPK